MHSSSGMVPGTCHTLSPSTASLQPSSLNHIPLAKVSKIAMHSKPPFHPRAKYAADIVRYNRVFPALARSITNTPTDKNGIWYITDDWTDGAQLSLRFANGSSTTIEKTATPKERFFSYQNGTELYNINCLPRSLSSASRSTPSAEEASEVTGLPETAWRNSANSVAGYFSNLTDLEDTGIIFLPTFSSSPQEVAEVTTDFLRNATAAGKKYILIDVAANPGGYMSSGIDLFRNFFPGAFPYTATRFRAHEAAQYLTKAYSRDTRPDSSNTFAYRQMVTPDQQSGFSSWEDLYGPHEILGSSSSSLLANFNFTSTSTTVYPINGYGPVPLNPDKALFPAENIVIVSTYRPSLPRSRCSYLTPQFRSQTAIASQPAPSSSN